VHSSGSIPPTFARAKDSTPVLPRMVPKALHRALGAATRCCALPSCPQGEERGAFATSTLPPSSRRDVLSCGGAQMPARPGGRRAAPAPPALALALALLCLAACWAGADTSQLPPRFPAKVAPALPRLQQWQQQILVASALPAAAPLEGASTPGNSTADSSGTAGDSTAGEAAAGGSTAGDGSTADSGGNADSNGTVGNGTAEPPLQAAPAGGSAAAVEFTPSVFIFSLNDLEGSACRDQVDRAAQFATRSIQVSRRPLPMHGWLAAPGRRAHAATGPSSAARPKR
jgi:hypothetical protein